MKIFGRAYFWSGLTVLLIVGGWLFWVVSESITRQCEGNPNYEARIRACNVAIKSSLLDKSGLAVAFNNRGVAYSLQGDYERAIKDYDRAIKLTPTYPYPFINRGFAYAHFERYERAIEDYDEAIRLNPKDADGFLYRGLAYEDLGQYERAIKDYDESHLLKPEDLFVPLYRFVAAARIGDEEARTTLVRQTGSFDLGKWPSVFVRMFLGDIEPEDTLVAAAANKQQTETESLCEAYYFIGVWHLLKGETEMAAFYFQSAVDTNAVEFIEYDLSRVELKQMGK